MERKENEDPDLTLQSKGLDPPTTENGLSSKSTISPDTDKVVAPPGSTDQISAKDKEVDTEEIEVLNINFWIKKSEHKVRLAISICILCLFVGWVLAGIIVFSLTRNFSLLLYGSPILIPFQWVLSYYFPRHNRR